jgi:hypothetical protein
MTQSFTDAEAVQRWLAEAGRHLKNGPQFAAALRILADRFDTMTEELSTGSYVGLTIMPKSPGDVELIAAALGIPTATEKMAGDAYHRKATRGGISVFAPCPPPTTAAREVLAAQLAELDAQIAREAKAAARE